MQSWVQLFLAAVAGAVIGLLVLRGQYAARLAAASAQRDALRERVADLTVAAERAADERAEQARHTAGELAPLAESLRRVETQVHALERERGEQFARVALELSRVQSSTDGLREQTASLVGSLSSSTVRGSWGEVTLRRVLEASGMLARCDFDTQVTGSVEGAVVRPDVVVHLPGDKHLALDAKAPMTEYLAAHTDGLTAAERTARLRAHARALRRHVEALATKGYWAAFEGTPEFVVCFVPGEGMLAAALEADPSLHEHAMRRGVVLAAPATLLALLRTVATAWRQDSLAEGARELLTLGQELYARIGTVGRHTQALGEVLGRAVTAYDALVGSVESRLLVTARRMDALGLGDGAPVASVTRVEAGPRSVVAPELRGA